MVAGCGFFYLEEEEGSAGGEEKDGGIRKIMSELVNSGTIRLQVNMS